MRLSILSTLLLTLALFSLDNGYAQFVSTIQNSTTERFTDGLALDSEGTIYCSNYLGDKVYKKTLDGLVSVFAQGFTNPNGLAFDASSNLFVCDNGANRIIKFALDGTPLDTFMVSGPSAIIKNFDSDTMTFTQYGPNKISTLAPDGVVSQTHSAGLLNGPIGIAYDDEGQLYVGNFNDREIYRVFPDSLQYVATVPGPNGGWLGFISYGDGTLWGTSYHANSIYRISTDAVNETELYSGSSLGNMDGPIAEATFSRPNGIITSTMGDTIYVSQYVSGELRMISPLPNSLTDLSKDEFSFSVFPNPSPGTIELSITTDVFSTEILDLRGRILSISNNQRSIDLSALSSGYYVLRVKDADQQVIGLKQVMLE